MNLMKASKQWATRPTDERYASLDAMLADARMRQQHHERTTSLTTDVAVVEDADDLHLAHANASHPVRLTNWAFGQMCQEVGAPASYLRTLPSHMASELANYHLRSLPEPKEWSLHELRNGGEVVRAITSPRYTTIWDADIIERLTQLEQRGWRVPPARPAYRGQIGSRPATQDDVLSGARHSLSINVGDMIAPAGLYMSDRDMFAFMVNEDRRVTDRLARGFFIENSEVRGGSWVLTGFYYDSVCGNHIVWGASRVTEVRIRHVGWADDRAFEELTLELRKHDDASAEPMKQLIEVARVKVLGKNKGEVLDTIFKLRKPQLTQDRLSLAYDLCEATEPNENPRSVWGMVCGLTRASQLTKWQDARSDVDRAAGALLALA